MKFLIDTQQDTLRERMETSDLICGQLLTPLTGYSYWGGQYAIDNGAYSGFPAEKFKRLLARQENQKAECLFVTCPDVVGSGRRSLELFQRRRLWIPEGWRIALVIQDGMEDLEIPWDDLDAIFIGGLDPWKDSKAAADIVKTATILNKWKHIGRVNSPQRFEHFLQLGADSCDGSGVAKYDHMLEKFERRNDPKPSLFDVSI